MLLLLLSYYYYYYYHYYYCKNISNAPCLQASLVQRRYTIYLRFFFLERYTVTTRVLKRYRMKQSSATYRPLIKALLNKKAFRASDLKDWSSSQFRR